MAYQVDGQHVTLPFGATGVRGPHRAVALNASGELIYPSAAGKAAIGVLVTSGTTGSTDHTGKVGTVKFAGVAKVEAPASTLSAGDLFSWTSRGQARAITTAHACAGYVVGGSSGSTGRILSVVLLPFGSSAIIS